MGVKRIISALVALATALTLSIGGTNAQARRLARNETDGAPEESAQEHATGYIASDNTYTYPTPEEESEACAGRLFETIPSSYDGRQYQTPVKDQSDNGMCWAFAACGALEANLKKTGAGELDFSELHMGYSTSVYKFNGELVNKDQGVTFEGNKTWNTIIDGANRETAGNYLMRGTAMSGAVYEEEDPYLDRVTVLRDPAITAGKHKCCYARDILFITGERKCSDTRAESIKKAILTYGSAEASMVWDDGCFQTDNSAYYYRGSDKPDHDVMLVGWDDSYKKENFSEAARPKSNGAWLVKNSWGDDWGDGGYFWISYEDTGFPSYVTAYCGADEWNSLMHVYESDYKSLGAAGEETGSMFAKVFAIKGGTQSVESIRLFIPEGGSVTASVDVIPDFKGFEGYVFSKCGRRSIVYPGWYTIDLDSQVRLAESGRFAVVVRLEGTESIGCDETELDASADAKAYIYKNGAFESTTENWSIKALSVSLGEPVKYERLSFDANGGSGIMPVQFIATGKSTELNENCYTRDYCDFAGWNTKPDGSGTAYTDGALIKLKKDLTLYAQWSAAWSLSDKGTLTVWGTGDADLPPWAEQTDRVRKAVIREGVKSIGNSAFKDCVSLTDVTIPDSVSSIGWWAFENCRSLSGISIPDSVTQIGGWAFNGCESLESISIPSSVEDIAGSALAGCKSLCAVTVEKGNRYYTDIDGVLFSKDGSKLITYPAGKKAVAYAVPDGVKSIEDYSFYACGPLAEAIIPDGVTSIGWWAFSSCASLVAVSLPCSLNEIRGLAFSDCTSLKSISIPRGVTRLGWMVFKGCTALEDIALPGGLTGIGIDTFMNCAVLSDVWYGGSKAQWETLAGNAGSVLPLDVTVHCDTFPVEITSSARAGNSVIISAHCIGYAHAAAVCAADDDRGRLTGIQTKTLAEGRETVVEFTGVNIKNGTVKVFVVDGNGAPLCSCAVLDPVQTG